MIKIKFKENILRRPRGCD